MKNGLPYYKRYPRDLIEGTVEMTLEVKGAYSILIDLIYMQGGDLPDQPRYISGLLGCSVRKWNSIRKVLLGEGKITTNGRFISNDRAVIELETLRKYQEEQAEKGAASNKNKGLQSPRFSQSKPKPDIYPLKSPEGGRKRETKQERLRREQSALIEKIKAGTYDG